MPQLASHPDEEVRHALEILAAADTEVLEQQLRVAAARLNGLRAKLRKTELSLATDELATAMSGLHSAVDPTTARAAQATENVWREIADQFGLLKSGEVSVLLGASKGNREFVSTRRGRGELLGVVRNNGYLFPGFQFDRSAGTVRPWVEPLLALAAENRRSATDVLFWMMSPSTYFDGDRPADHVDNGDRLLDVAERAWGIVW